MTAALATKRNHAVHRQIRRYVAGFNARYHRTGTLWEGRFKAGLIDTERYLFTCHRYIELNPVRAAMVSHPGDYRWSSFHHNTCGTADPLIAPHAVYLALGQASDPPRAAHRALSGSAISDDDIAAIRIHVQQQKVLGDSCIQASVAPLLARRVDVRPRGRLRRLAPSKKGGDPIHGARLE